MGYVYAGFMGEGEAGYGYVFCFIVSASRGQERLSAAKGALLYRDIAEIMFIQ